MNIEYVCLQMKTEAERGHCREVSGKVAIWSFVSCSAMRQKHAFARRFGQWGCRLIPLPNIALNRTCSHLIRLNRTILKHFLKSKNRFWPFFR
jgi:hypothetical protein